MHLKEAFNTLNYKDYYVFCTSYIPTREELEDIAATCNPTDFDKIFTFYNCYFKFYRTINLINEIIPYKYLDYTCLSVENIIKHKEIPINEKFEVLKHWPAYYLIPYAEQIEELVISSKTEYIPTEIKLLLAGQRNCYVAFKYYDYCYNSLLLCFGVDSCEAPEQWNLPHKLTAAELFNKIIHNEIYTSGPFFFPSYVPIETFEDILNLNLKNGIVESFLGCLLYDRKPLSLVNQYISYYAARGHNFLLAAFTQYFLEYLFWTWDEASEEDKQTFGNFISQNIIDISDKYIKIFNMRDYITFNNEFRLENPRSIMPLYSNRNVNTLKEYLKFVEGVEGLC